MSTAFLAWPVAIFDRIAPREEASSWYEFQMAQAFWFGAISWGVGLLALAWPLLLSFLIPNVLLTIWLYAVAMLADVALFVVWIVLAIRYSRKAARGDLFDVPWVTRLTGASSHKR